jgi:hypothetical protein
VLQRRPIDLSSSATRRKDHPLHTSIPSMIAKTGTAVGEGAVRTKDAAVSWLRL